MTSVAVAGVVLAFAACDSDDEIVPADSASPTPTLTSSHSPTLSPSASSPPPTLSPNLTAQPPTLAPPTTSPSILDALAAARARWEAAGIQSYQYDLEWACFCGRPDEPIKIVVHEGEFASASYAAGESVTPGTYYDIVLMYSTIDRSFQQIDSEVHTPGRFVLEAAFDPNLGFPTRIYSDSYYATDSGMSVTISNFEVLP
jgi:hypothetical protein